MGYRTAVVRPTMRLYLKAAQRLTMKLIGVILVVAWIATSVLVILGGLSVRNSVSTELKKQLTEAQERLAQRIDSLKVEQVDPFKLSDKQCIKAPVSVALWPGSGVTARIGETIICGTDRGWFSSGRIVGPTIDESEEFAKLHEELRLWQDCAESLALCPEGFKRLD